MRAERLDDRVVRQLYRQSNAERWGLTVDRFRFALEESVARAQQAHGDVERYLTALHLEDLALAAACADGVETAWDHFVREHRPVLYRAADAIDRTGAAREAADSLYAELFGLTEREGERRSLFRYFHGRSSLATWLRAVLSQRYVDSIRRTRRLEPLPDEDAADALPSRTQQTPEPDRHRFVSVIAAAIAAAVGRLDARDRLRLACYYAQDLTLAQIGRLLREHEATASRHLAKSRRAIREDVERQLRGQGLSEAEVEECFASVAADPGPLNVSNLLEAGRKTSLEDRST
ncbi:MAG TPA: sigma-70 family RNA polymerase sigma factor [Vicinamibacterales bacterium]|nr:sigma-70 family RNA polymerase sigma factor [Vicinamibacterales bacterium]